MTAEVIKIEDAQARFERDRKIFRLKLGGFPTWQIAEQLGCSAEDVRAGLTRMCAGVTPELRARTVEINLERIEDLFQVWYAKARKGDAEAVTVICRLMDRQAKYLGIDVMPGAVAAVNEKREPARFEKIYEAIMRIGGGPLIEGEAVEVKDKKDE